jgi:hypothetical protein
VKGSVIFFFDITKGKVKEKVLERRKSERRFEQWRERKNENNIGFLKKENDNKMCVLEI